MLATFIPGKPIGRGLIFGICLIFLACGASAGSEAEPESRGASTREKERLNAEALIKLAPRKACFEVLQGENKDRPVPMELRAANEKEDQWRLSFEGLYRLGLTRSAKGAVQVRYLEMLEDDKRLCFSPPFELIPARFVAGEQVQNNGEIRIENLETGRQTDSGKYCHIIKALSRTTLATPAGPKTGYLLEYESRINLSYSNIHLDLETGWSGNRELVYWRSQTTVEKLGLFSETTFRALGVTNSEACE